MDEDLCWRCDGSGLIEAGFWPCPECKGTGWVPADDDDGAMEDDHA